MTELNKSPERGVLKLCPFCGGRAYGTNGFYACAADADICHFSGFLIEPHSWQNAWCHTQLAEKDRRIAELEETIRQGQKRLDWMVTPDKKLSYAECEIKELQAKVDSLQSTINHKDEMLDTMAGALEYYMRLSQHSHVGYCRECQALDSYKAMKGEK